MALAIARIDAPSRDYFLDPRNRSRPVVVTNAARESPALQKWTPEFLASAMGATALPIRSVIGGRPDCRARKGAGYRTIEMPASEYFERLSRHDVGSLYLSLIPLLDTFPALARDLPAPDYVAQPAGVRPLLWIGDRGTFTALHYDRQDNFHLLVAGRKRFRLYDRRERERMYPHSMFSRCAHLSRVDVNAPEPARYPDFQGATAYDTTLEPGDMLFLPREWWHAVWTDETSVAVNYWWGPASRLTLPTLRLAVSFLVDEFLRVLEGTQRHPDSPKRSSP